MHFEIYIKQKKNGKLSKIKNGRKKISFFSDLKVNLN